MNRGGQETRGGDVFNDVRLSRVRAMFWLLALAMLVVVILAAKA